MLVLDFLGEITLSGSSNRTNACNCVVCVRACVRCAVATLASRRRRSTSAACHAPTESFGVRRHGQEQHGQHTTVMHNIIGTLAAAGARILYVLRCHRHRHVSAVLVRRGAPGGNSGGDRGGGGGGGVGGGCSSPLRSTEVAMTSTDCLGSSDTDSTSAPGTWQMHARVLSVSECMYVRRGRAVCV